MQLLYTDQTDLKSSPVELPFYHCSMVECGSNNEHGYHRHIADSDSKVTPPSLFMRPSLTNQTRSRQTIQVTEQTFAKQYIEDYEDPRIYLGSTAKK